jgi:hypothetical protein
MTMASLGPRQIRPIGAWVKYAHVLLQANEAIFINSAFSAKLHAA